ncbi:hypothetical protein OCU04_006606 [Sclerotinia nivalis]|uniref:Uncharacterized protein n=1 Tax=Sclerotinia nivalis TaxID=352851 RepID=A0A9X0DJ28_9HELO|nr:hypothetical protein OCU04_006606 [Sclerotinia nivalis]
MRQRDKAIKYTCLSYQKPTVRNPAESSCCSRFSSIGLVWIESCEDSMLLSQSSPQMAIVSALQLVNENPLTINCYNLVQSLLFVDGFGDSCEISIHDIMHSLQK